MSCENKKLHLKFLDNLLWPAVAGNVLWALISVIVSATRCIDYLPNAITLAFLSSYFIFSFFYPSKNNPVKDSFYVDMFLLVSIAFFAIALGEKVTWLKYPLSIIYVVALIGHWSGAWKSTIKGIDSFKIGIYILGLALLIIFNNKMIVHGSFGLVVILWICTKIYENKKVKELTN